MLDIMSQIGDTAEPGKGMQRKKHSREEIATKLSKADELHERGKTQAEIAMTYHRWRKTRSQPGLNGTRVPDLPQSAVEELHKENGRLRQLLTETFHLKAQAPGDRQGAQEQLNSPRAATAVPAQPRPRSAVPQAIGELPPASAVAGLSDPL